MMKKEITLLICALVTGCFVDIDSNFADVSDKFSIGENSTANKSILYFDHRGYWVGVIDKDLLKLWVIDNNIIVAKVSNGSPNNWFSIDLAKAHIDPPEVNLVDLSHIKSIASQFNESEKPFWEK